MNYLIASLIVINKEHYSCLHEIIHYVGFSLENNLILSEKEKFLVLHFKMAAATLEQNLTKLSLEKKPDEPIHQPNAGSAKPAPKPEPAETKETETKEQEKEEDKVNGDVSLTIE